MNVWLINPYGPLPGEGWRDYRFTLIAKALAGRGHRVTWWTASFAHQTKRFRSRRREKLETSERFAIELVPTPSYRSNIGAGRLWFEYAFAQRLEQFARSASPPDVIVAADPPQFSGAAGRRLAARHHATLVIDCLDLWPELFVSASSAPLRPFVRAAVQPLFALRRRNLRAAALTIAVAEPYRAVAEREGARRSITIPIGVDVRAIAPSAERRAGARLTVVYAGTLGEAYDLMTVIKAFAMLKRDAVPLDLVVAGQGPAEARLRAEVGRASLGNVRFAGVIDAAGLSSLYRTADIGLAPYLADSTVALPVKFFDYLAAGLPIVTSISTDLRGAAAQYEPGNSQSLRDALRSLAADANRRHAMSTAARELAAEFDARILYDRYATEIEALAAP